MAFYDHVKADLQKTVFLPKPDGFADPIEYTPKGQTGIDTFALIDFGEDILQHVKGSARVGTMVLDLAVVGFPKKGDTVLYDNEVYAVVRILERDSEIAKTLVRSDLRGTY